ncbi:MAG: imidazolonepropionase [Planctomycetes bacterium]|nr:imidazolonepropionase [Planctomycetota bacterium]NUQ34069.1 imidazolonepropionase [Planctomycetaceae bacterium]
MQPCDTLLVNIGSLATLAGDGPLLGSDLGSWQVLNGPCAIAVKDGRVLDAGTQADIESRYRAATTRDMDGALVTPGLVDCHTHPVFVGNRAEEFEMRLKGATYESIMAAGGGIASSVKKLRAADDATLDRELRLHLDLLKAHGVVALEAKSGYGLSLEHERRSLQAIERAQGYAGLTLVPTCLAAHTVPAEFKGRTDDYVALVCDEVLPAIAREKLALAADVFIERGTFSADQGRRVLKRAKELGLATHVHADQLSAGEGTRVAIECGALSADHLEYVDDATIALMAKSGTAAVLLPGSTFFLRQDHWAPARKLIDAGAPIALATDFNPGSSPTASPAFIMTLACLMLAMTPKEALACFTRNAAHVLRIGADYGSIEPGKRAAFTIWHCADVHEIPYWFGANLVRETLIV